jgi:hypothetical protein
VGPHKFRESNRFFLGGGGSVNYIDGIIKYVLEIAFLNKLTRNNSDIDIIYVKRILF